MRMMPARVLVRARGLSFELTVWQNKHSVPDFHTWTVRASERLKQTEHAAVFDVWSTIHQRLMHQRVSAAGAVSHSFRDVHSEQRTDAHARTRLGVAWRRSVAAWRNGLARRGLTG